GDDPDVLAATGTAMLIALENARLQADLRASIAELEDSRSRVASAADEERRRIERDLHDGAQQGLIALQIRLTQLQQRARADPQSLSRELQDAREHVDAALNQIRNLAQGIYPPVLSDLGIRGALKSIARELPLQVVIDVDCARRFAPEIEAAVYFCCLEALQNIAKHCRPDATVKLTLSDNPNGLEFEIADDGQGFDPATIPNSRGITGMRDRLETIGGELTVSSSPGAGTSVSGRVPPAALKARSVSGNS
ncbi:MAG: sensor histidine kinase, partial [Gaiellaceae bacterium]